MGYAMVGYPTRPHKRRRRVPHQDLFRIYYENNHLTRTKKRNIASTANHDNILFPLTVHRKLTLQDLPTEIIQRIFVLSQEVDTMPILNRFFFHSLRVQPSLQLDMLWERHIFYPEEYNITEYVGQDGKFLLKPIFFNNLNNIAFFYNNFEFFNHKILKILSKDTFAALEDGSFDTSNEIDFNTFPSGDYPSIFYDNIGIFFKFEGIVELFKKYFTFENPSHLIAQIFNWLFYRQDRHTISQIFPILDSICSTSDLSPDPLFEILQILFVDNSNSDSYLCKLLELPTHESHELLAKKLKWVESFIFRYYSKSNESLSDPNIWHLLKKISNVNLIDLIINYGGTPQYSSMV
ncbi:hypothetical protein KAFR_0E02870 [Kazachstania africana CBS 2517]|uniref:F-box domain-containing protein n=1 Tax=Kazachstania africana (strain ATCC 22294 / BCRC 22015 / CBS 2517 / CECT 1963 / NBRC 1671 / NRRL Y-8276) TaxID=1071382 RepID=H2AVN9_KAZAF|nr:hypothetical protein KAFR_0E02870 [Kazachstania africana CBS 2517]CCF58439.1 hypothetical protein KAFR_0E02870 [Kazachstania africana CBS 2517]